MNAAPDPLDALHAALAAAERTHDLARAALRHAPSGAARAPVLQAELAAHSVLLRAQRELAEAELGESWEQLGKSWEPWNE